MRIMHTMAVLVGLGLGIAGQTALLASPLVDGRFGVPPRLVPRVANSVITTLYGVPVGTARTDGSFSLPPSPVDDIEILYVRAPVSDEVIVMGYADGDIYNLGVEGTALALLLMSDPANALLDRTAKRDFFQNARQQADFPALTQAVEAAVADGTMSGNFDATAPARSADKQLVALLAKVRQGLPRQPQTAAY